MEGVNWLTLCNFGGNWCFVNFRGVIDETYNFRGVIAYLLKLQCYQHHKIQDHNAFSNYHSSIFSNYNNISFFNWISLSWNYIIQKLIAPNSKNHNSTDMTTQKLHNSKTLKLNFTMLKLHKSQTLKLKFH